MIIIGFIIDYIVMLLLPINTYFVVLDIDKNKLSNVIIVGIILDILFGKLFINTIILILLYFIVRRFDVKRKYRLVMNLIIYCLFMIVGIII